MSKINMEKLKEIVKELNAATYSDGEGNDVPFLDTKIKILGVTPEKLQAAFETAIGDMDDSITGNLSESIIDYYNGEGADPEPEPVQTKAKAAPEAPAASCKAAGCWGECAA